MVWEVFLLVWVSAVVGNPAVAQPTSCRDRCGEISVRFPFGIDPGCGDPEHQLNCSANGVLTLDISGGDTVAVASITEDTLMINTTSLLSSFYSPTCIARLDPNAYDVSEEETLVCVLVGFPDPPNEIQDGCSFERATEVPLDIPWINYVRCFNYTKKKGGGSLNPVVVFAYSEIHWIVRENWMELCDSCTASHGTCGYNTTDASFRCIKATASSSSSYKLQIGAAAGAAVLFLLFVGVCCYIYKRRRTHNLCGFGSQGSFTSKELESGKFTFKELEEATYNFSKARFLGGGGFGTVYKGQLLDGRLVAVKKLHSSHDQGRFQFENEVNILSQVRHPFLVQLYGWCSKGPELLLVYEFVENGTLGDHIHRNRGGFMEWDRRLKVVTQTAEALAWLHTNINPPIFHRDVKSENILIDDEYNAKVGDFGISRLVPSLDLTHVSTAPQGTLGYLDPDYFHTCQLTSKSDVYSFGVVLMEVVSSKRAVDTARDTDEISLAAHAELKSRCGQLEKLVDPKLVTEFDPVRCRMAEAVAKLGIRCLAANKNDRPCMREVALELEQIGRMGND